MEIFNFYQIGNTLFYMFTGGRDEVLGITFGIIFGIILWITMFVLQGVGLFVMAKHRNLKNKWLCFVPFANIYYMGRLAGECGFFGHRMKNAGVYAMIAQIISTLLAGMYIFSEWYLYYNHGAPQQSEALASAPLWTGLSGFSLTVSRLYDISIQLFMIFSLISQLLMLVLVMGLYKKYVPKNYMGISMLTMFVPAARFVTLFVLRNNNAVDYEAYMRARREEYFRHQQQYRGGNPYGQNPYGQNPYTPPKQEDPFEEFASSKTKGDSSSESKDGDGFFD